MDFFDKVKEKINGKFNPEDIILIDNSSLHKKHKSFDPNKIHLKIILKSKKLKNMDIKLLMLKRILLSTYILMNGCFQKMYTLMT